jgi:Protein of unknown function (DUF2934)
MQISRGADSAPKPARNKVKDAAPATITVKKPRSRKKVTEAVETPIDVMAMHPSPDELMGMIATTAYFIAAERNFTPGQELDDWLEAERRVRRQYPD